LIKDGTFSLPGKKALFGDEVEYEVILIDATESPIERPKKGGKENIIRARKNTTRLKSQVVVDKTSKIVICTEFCEGKCHEISKKRIFVENVMGAVKYFKILARRYRNRRKRFGLRFNLMAGIYNFELKV
jgi:hypothetical protein